MLYDYILHWCVLEHVTMAKYLGVTIQHDMKWNTHINKITTSSYRSLAFLRRNLQVNSHELKTVAYNALVRPLLEYAPSVWDPHTKQGMSQVEKVVVLLLSTCYNMNSLTLDLPGREAWSTLCA